MNYLSYNLKASKRSLFQFLDLAATRYLGHFKIEKLLMCSHLVTGKTLDHLKCIVGEKIMHVIQENNYSKSFSHLLQFCSG